MKPVAALVLASTAAIAMAAEPRGTIRGALAYPGEAIPPLVVIARGLDGQGDFRLQTRAGQRSYRIAVPPGRYIVFAAPIEARDPRLRGAYTAYSQCNRIIRAYFSDRSRPFQADRSRRFIVIVAEEGPHA